MTTKNRLKHDGKNLEDKLSNIVLTLIKDKEQLSKVHKAYTRFTKYLMKIGVEYPGSTADLLSDTSDEFQKYRNSYKPNKKEVPTQNGKGFIGGAKYE